MTSPREPQQEGLRCEYDCAACEAMEHAAAEGIDLAGLPSVPSPAPMPNKALSDEVPPGFGVLVLWLTHRYDKTCGEITAGEVRALYARMRKADAVPAPSTALPDLSGVTRFEVIDHRRGAPEVGRVFVAWNASGTLSMQDGGRTLKLFIDGEVSP